jgi:hypothetical protein
MRREGVTVNCEARIPLATWTHAGRGRRLRECSREIGSQLRKSAQHSHVQFYGKGQGGAAAWTIFLWWPPFFYGTEKPEK